VPRPSAGLLGAPRSLGRGLAKAARDWGARRRAGRPDPAALGRPEPVLLATADGLALRGWWWRHQPPGWATAVVAHGFSASCRDPAVLALVEHLHAGGMDVLAYDARGHGGSEGVCSLGRAEHLDVRAALERLGEPEGPVVLVGISMGAVAVVGYLVGAEVSGGPAPPAHRQLAGAVVASSPSRWRVRPTPLSVVNAVLTKTRPGRWLAHRRMNVRIEAGWRTPDPPEAAIGRVRLPMAFVHGERDRLLSTDHALRLACSVGGASRLVVVPGMGHGIDARGCQAVLEACYWVLSCGRQAELTAMGSRAGSPRLQP
jgi:alpha-beta hydrolase superfamily lysophospholipase